MTSARTVSFAAAASMLALMIGLPLTLAARGTRITSPGQATEKDFNRENFSNPTRIDNKWLPMAPGTEYVYRGRSNLGGGLRPHRLVMIVTDLTKVINGVRTVVVWDGDFHAGRLEEGELAFFAQDNDRNIWALGEYPEAYDKHGKFIDAPNTWIVGANAKPGINMRGSPRPVSSSYRQGYAPSIGWGDRAKVNAVGQRTCVPVGCYDNVLVTDETNLFEAGDGHQLKYYARNLGNVRTEPGTGSTEQEVLELVKIVHLDRQALAKVGQAAMRLDRRAYVARKALYRRTSPAEPRPRAG
jgi:hypothetical protein